MLSIGICDDEMLECCSMAKLIKEIMEEKKIPFIMSQFYHGEDLLQAAEDFDIIFLDIMMYGMNGMETARLLRDNGFHKILIFISASRDYILDAYDVEAFYYMIKPLERNKLSRLLERSVQKLEPDSEDFILIGKERQMKKLLLKDIYYFEIRGRIVSVHGAEGVFDYYEKISVLEQALSKKGFFRCHKSFLINLKHVNTYNHQEVTLDNGANIVIAKRRWEDFCKEILDYMKKSGGSS